MSSFKGNYEFLFFGKDDNSFLENYYYDLFQDFGDKSGQVFVNLEVQNNPVDAEEIGTLIFKTLQKVFFEDVAKSPYERFEVALKAVNSVLADLKEQKVSGFIGNLNVVIAAIVGKELYLTASGDSEAYLIRKRYVSLVSEGLAEEAADSEDVFASIASGEIEEGDFVIFSTTRLLRYISKTDLAGAAASGDVKAALAEVQDVISTEILGRVGLTGIVFEQGSAEDVEEVVEGGSRARSVKMAGESGDVETEKSSVAGRFLTIFKGVRLKGLGRRKAEMFDGGRTGGLKSSARGAFGKFKGMHFGDGFLGKEKILGGLVAVIVLLLIGIWFANGQMAQREEIGELNDILINVDEKIAEAKTKSATDKEAAKALLDTAYADAMTVLSSEFFRDKATIYLVQIDEARDSLDNVRRLESPEVYAEIPGANAVGMVAVDDRIFAYGSQELYEVVLDEVAEPVVLDENEQIIAATGFDDRGSLVFLTESGKLIEYNDGTISFMDTDDGTFRRADAIEDWSNRIYLLGVDDGDAGRQVYRYNYSGPRARFGEGEAYVIDEAVDLAGAVDLAIDASVYVLKNGGEIQQYYGGEKQEFFINNAPFGELTDPKEILTNEKLDQIFVLDGKEARVLVYFKDSRTGDIVYDSQFLFEGVGDLRGMHVDPEDRVLYVIGANAIYKVNI